MPAWIGWGAGLLAWNAGLINAVGLMGFSHEAISHISGVTSQTGLALSRGNTRQPPSSPSPTAAS